jgi:hypothetical protein
MLMHKIGLISGWACGVLLFLSIVLARYWSVQEDKYDQMATSLEFSGKSTDEIDAIVDKHATRLAIIRAIGIGCLYASGIFGAVALIIGSVVVFS